jgi:small-conductance mechanosensitive channel
MNWDKQEIFEYSIPILIVVGTLVGGYIMRGILFRYLQRMAERTVWEGDDIVIAATRSPFLVWVLMIGIYVAVRTSKFLPQEIKDGSQNVILGLAIFSVSLTAANILADLIRRSTVRAQVPTPGLIPNIIRILVIGIGSLAMLSTFIGFERIAPLLAAFGVGGLAVALALQDTLSNLFAGFYITLNKQIRVGDLLKLETGYEGVVVDINWRTTTIKDGSQNLVIVPNAKLAQMTVTNFALPEPHMTVRIHVGVSYESDPAHVERVLLDEARQVMTEFEGFVPKSEPIVRFTNFLDSSMEFVVFLHIQDHKLNMPLQTEIRKHIIERFKREGIEIPYSMRTVRIKPERTN